MNSKVYPLHSSLVNSLRTVDAVLLAARLVRSVAVQLNIGLTEVEILIGLAPQTKPTSFIEVCDFVPHLTKDRIKRLLHGLHKDCFVTSVSSDDDHGMGWVIAPSVLHLIKSVDKLHLLAINRT